MVYGGNGDFWKGDRENLFLTSPPTLSVDASSKVIFQTWFILQSPSQNMNI